MSRKFVIQGGRSLSGRYPVQGNKNAALPLIAASLLSSQPVLLRNMPRIVDVENLLCLLQPLGVQTRWSGGALEVDPSGLRPAELEAEVVRKLRGAILLLGALVPRFHRLTTALPGGCPLGRRSFDMHWRVFRAAGFSIQQTPEEILVEKEEPVPDPEIYLEESSVTATENALLLLASLGRGRILNPAREPHVFSLIDFLGKLGVDVELHPLYYRIRSGLTSQSRPVEFSLPGDYIDAGSMAIAAAATGGRVTLSGIRAQEWLGIRTVLEHFGLAIEPEREDLWRVQAPSLHNPPQVIAGPWPLFPTDLISLVTVLATQGEGLCLVHDWMYESRMFFVDKLVRMGARITMCDPHRVLVDGPTLLRGTRLESPDIRAGMALVIAGLCARGTTTIEHAEVILRGYESVVERLQGLGAAIEEA